MLVYSSSRIASGLSLKVYIIFFDYRTMARIEIGFNSSCPISLVLVYNSIITDPYKLRIKAIYNSSLSSILIQGATRETYANWGPSLRADIRQYIL